MSSFYIIIIIKKRVYIIIADQVCAGIERAEFMVKFLEDLLHPLTLLVSLEQVKDFMAQHDVSVCNFSVCVCARACMCVCVNACACTCAPTIK